MYENDLIFGKSKIENIVSCEPSDDGLILIKEVSGELQYEVIPNKFWLITKDRISSKQKELDGDQYYKYIAEFDTLKEKMAVRDRKSVV